MADGRRYGLAPKLDIGTILNEAQHRWLRPAEVCEILRNYKRFQISPEPPNRPTDGSIFLFDRKTLRYFRKDGHNWRKKKDGKTVREAHERLKAGSIDVLHCYYAHGEDNENFQRRSYWMLEEQFEHIVLVHYREVKEGGKSGIFHPVISQSPTQVFNAASTMNPLYSSPAQSNSYLAQKSYTSTPSTSEWNGTPTSDFEEVESGENLGVSSSAETEYSLAKQVHSQRLPKETVGLLSETGLRQQQHVEAFSNIASENRCNYSSFNVDNLEPRQQPLYPLAPSQQNFFECSNESQMTMTFQNSYTHDYNNNEISNRIDSHGLHVNSYPEQCVFPPVTSAFPESNYSSIRERKTEVVTNVTANRDAINSSIWPEIPELERNYIINSAGEKNVDNLESTMMEDIVRRQIQSGVAYNTDGNKHMKSECDVNNQDCLQTQEDNNSIPSLQSGHYLKTSESPFSISDQQIIGLENGFLNLFQQKMSKSRSREQIREPPLLQHCQERVVEGKINMKLMTESDLFNDSSAMQGTNTQLQESTIDIDREEALKKLDSFGKWMTSEIGEDAENSLTVSDSGMYWNTLDNQNEAEEASRSSHQIQLDNSLMVPSVSQDQLFSISDFSPDWAYSEVATKVLIWGNFLGNSQDVYREKFSVMFGEIEVPVEALGPGIFRCYTPPHFPGTVPFYITSSNRLACSEVKEFHYRQDTSQITTSNRNMFEDSMNEMRLKTRFVKLLLDDLEKGLAKLDEDKMLTLKSKICFLIKDIDEELREIERALEDDAYSFERVNEKLIQKLLMDKLYSWLLWKVNAGEKGANVLDDQGQGVIHLAAALGYDWAIKPIVSSGVNVNFRDAHGWTALHWAAFYGRERTVSALIALKANPGALTDPTHEHPTGRTPADFASNNGHKGIAGYLAESSLTNHLSSLTLTENIMGSVSATIAAEKAVENVADRSLVQVDGGKEDQLSMKDSLAAVRNAAQAAARIQAAFRMRSFRRRQAIEYEGDKSRIAEERALSRMSRSKTCRSGKPEESLHTAATQIQRKFRGWKGRKEFLLTRQRIVKIQAHFRGHQVRKKYRLLWSVGIVEKAILRWRRKGTGLRGFRNDDIDEVHSDVIPNKDIDDYEFLRNARKQSEAGIEKALARVQSMVQYPEARNQYRRLLEIFQESKIEAEKYVKEDAQTSGEQKLNEDFPMSFAD